MTLDDLYIETKQDLIEAIDSLGFLPYFSNTIPGFSIEEHVHLSIWFSAQEGVWEWKGPIIQETKCAYGKFLHKKAMFISKKWFIEFANMRRDGYDFDSRFEDGLATYNEQHLYNIISSHHSIRSKTAKALGGYTKPRKQFQESWTPRKGFDTTLTKLQMNCYVITSDFDYELDKNGQFYGWGVAKYATPENFYGKSFTNSVYKHSPEESKKRIYKHFHKIIPNVTDDQIEYFLK